MASGQHEAVFEAMEGPHKTRVQPFVSGGSVVVSIDSTALDEFDIDPDGELPELDEWIHVDEGKIVLDGFTEQ
jgi:hypothetical protein